MTFKQPKPIKPQFKDQFNDPCNELNNRYPISIKYNEDLVNRVCARYPLIDRYKVSLIIKTVFKSMRELLLLGYSLRFKGIFNIFRIYYHTRKEKGIISPSLRVKITTPPELKGK
jgi:hypothetical protein